MSKRELSKFIRKLEREIVLIIPFNHFLQTESFSPIKSREDAESKRIHLFILFFIIYIFI